MTAYVQTLTDFISGNPNLAVVIVFFVAASEAIAVVGALVPGTAILIAIGAVVGLGHLPAEGLDVGYVEVNGPVSFALGSPFGG